MGNGPQNENNQEQVHTQVADWTYEGEAESKGDEMDFVYHQSLPRLMWKEHSIIDSQSSVDMLNNSVYLSGIHKVKKPLKLHCYAGCVNMSH